MKYIFFITAFICCTNSGIYPQTVVSLKSVVELALKNNPYYNTEKLNDEVAKTDITTAELKLNPSASISFEQVPFRRFFADNTSFPNPQNREAMLEIGKTFQVKGQRKLKIEKAEKSYIVSQSALKEYERNLILETAEKWLDVWYSINKMNIVRAAKRNSDSLLKINQVRLKNQVITNTEFLRTQIVDDQYSLLLRSSEQENIRELQNLRFLAGIDSTITVNGKDSVFILVISSASDSLINYAMQNRTDIVMTKKTVDAAKTNIRLQQAYAYPQPEIGFHYGTQEHIPYIGSFLSIPIPVFDRNQGEIAKSKAILSQTENLLYATNMKVRTEVANTWNEYTTNRTAYEKYRDIYSKSEKVLNVVKIAYLKGGTTILDYLEAERNWFDLQNQFYEAFYNYQKSYLELLYVTNLIQNI